MGRVECAGEGDHVVGEERCGGFVDQERGARLGDVLGEDGGEVVDMVVELVHLRRGAIQEGGTRAPTRWWEGDDRGLDDLRLLVNGEVDAVLLKVLPQQMRRRDPFLDDAPWVSTRGWPEDWRCAR